MKKITYLGPKGATFSELAYIKLAELFDTPDLEESDVVLAGNNQQVLPLVVNHGGYGVIAMETDAEGRVDGPVNTFIQLLQRFATSKDCPITVVGAIRMPLNFALMVRPGIQKENIKMVVAHPKALGACKNMVRSLTLDDPEKVIESDSNGFAANDVATNPKFAQAAALGPRIAAESYGLKILNEACEDRPAITTFFLLGQKRNSNILIGNRAILVFRVKHEPGSLVRVLLPFSDAELSLRQIHSHYTSEGQYDFAIEIECNKNQSGDLAQAVYKASKNMLRYVLFGPFPVV